MADMMAAGAGLSRGAALKVFFDGGCRPNPGAIETAVVARGTSYFRDDHGRGDNNDAEWLACLDALRVVSRIGATDVILIGDSTVVVRQASGLGGSIPSRFQHYVERFRSEAAGLERLRIRYVRRAQNLAGIALERRAGRI